MATDKPFELLTLRCCYINVSQEVAARRNDLQKQLQRLEHTEEMHRHGESLSASSLI